MSERATYLYCLTRSGVAIPDGLAGVEGDAPVRIFECGELAAAVGDVDRDVFESDAPSDPGWIVPRALRHEAVVETVMGLGPVMPVRFGTLYSTDEGLVSWVHANRGAIAEFLDHVADKEEWAIRMRVELGSALDTLILREAGWSARAGDLPSSPGARYFQEKRLRAEAQTHVRQAARAAAGRLRAEACGMAEERPLAVRKPDRADVEPILHSAYLVPRRSVASLAELAARAEGEAACVRLELTGPWPPSHFCPRLEAPEFK